MRGQPITKFCDENQLSTEARLRLFAEVCRGIQHAHQKGIIHRDIKPNNIMVTWHDDQAVPKVIDFGVAKATEHRLTEKTVFTSYAQMIGTPTYMSPEQARLGTDIDTRSDIYSLGVLLYELLAGSPPFDTRQLLTAGYDEMRRQICEDEPRSPSARISSLSDIELSGVAKSRCTEPAKLNRLLRGELDWIVIKAMEKDRRRRYASANTLGDDVRRYLSGEPVAAAAQSTVYRARKYFQGHRTFVTTATAIVTALLLGAIVATWQAIRATRQTARAQQSELVTKRNLYVTEMATAQREFNDLNTKRVLELLNKYLPKPDEPDFRGFEWRWLWNECHQEAFQLRGHSRLLRDLKFSPDGQWVASGSCDGTARLWKFQTRQEVWQYKGGIDCNRVDFSADGSLLVAHFYAPTEGRPSVVLWDISDPYSPTETKGDNQIGLAGNVDLMGEMLWQLTGKKKAGGRAAGHAFSKNGRTLAMLDWDGNGGIWDVPTGERLHEFPKHEGYNDRPVKGVAISPIDDDIIVTTSGIGTRIWSRDGKLKAHLLRADKAPQAMTEFSKDGRLLAVRQYAGAIRVFDTNSWKEVATFRTPMAGNTVAFSPIENDLLLAGGEDGVIRAWNVKSSKTVLEHLRHVISVEFSPDGNLLAVGLRNGAVWFWDLQTKSVGLKTPETRTNYSRPVFYTSYSGDFVAFASDGVRAAIIGPEEAVTLWHIPTANRFATIKHPDGGKYSSVAFSGDGKQLYLGTMEHGPSSGVQVWSLGAEGPNFIRKLEHPGFGVKCLALSTNSDIVASGQEGSVKLCNTKTHELKNTIELSSWQPLSLQFFNDGSNLATAGLPWGALIWDANTSRITTLPHPGEAGHISLSPQQDRLLVAGFPGTTLLWDISTELVIAEFDGWAAELSPDGTLLAVGGQGERWVGDDPKNALVTLYHAPPIKDIESYPSSSGD